MSSIPVVSGTTLADNAVATAPFAQASGALHLKITGATTVVSIVGSNTDDSDAAVLPLDDGSTTLTLVAGTPQVVAIGLPMARIGIKKISGAGVITATLSAPGQ